jgi:two-component system NtrC family sensor kinase
VLGVINTYTKEGHRRDKREEEFLTAVANALAGIIKRKQAEEALREAEERYRALIELGERSGEAVVMLEDTDKGTGMHIFASNTWARMTGYSREELLTMSGADLIHPRYREEAVARHRRRMRGEVLKELYEIAIVRKDGTEFSAEVTYAPSTYHGRQVDVGFIRDITERKKMEEQLMAQDRLASIGQLVSGVAHEINNPLTGVIGFSDMLLKRDLPDDVKEDLKVINDEAMRTARIVKNLLTFARKQPEGKTAVDINENIRGVLNLRDHEQKVNNIRVITHFASDLPRVIGNSSQLQQVFFNIVINAEFFMLEAHQKGNLTITTERIGDSVRASLTDDGAGISQKNMKNLFIPFFTTKEVGKGTGLGLSICHGIITEHGGRIYAESELGKGATFVVELPVSKQ